MKKKNKLPYVLFGLVFATIVLANPDTWTLVNVLVPESGPERYSYEDPDSGVVKEYTWQGAGSDMVYNQTFYNYDNYAGYFTYQTQVQGWESYY